jgi:AraC-like DNA-binding protein
MSHPTVAAAYIQHLLATASSLRVDVAGVLRHIQLSPAQLEQPDARIALPAHDLLWRHLSAQVGRERFGFAAGLRVSPAALGVGGHVVSSCQSGQEAIACFQRYRALIGGDQIVPRMFVHDAHVELRYAAVESAFAERAHSGESGMISMLKLVETLCGIRWAPLEVWFQHKRPARLEAYEELFACRLHFEKPYRRLLLRREVAELPLVGANAELHGYLSRHADSLLQRLRPEQTLSDRVRALLAQELARAEHQEERVARRLGMSARTLQRHLRGEGARFADLLDQVRRELAMSYLDDRRLSVSEIAFLLGYTEPSAFFRAFRRWTGTTPRVARHRS